MDYPIYNYYVEVSGSNGDPSQDVFYITTDNSHGENPSGVHIETPHYHFCEWKTYYFHQTGVSNSGHRLAFSFDMDGEHSEFGEEYTDEVTKTGVPGTSGAYTKIDVREGGAALGYSSFFYYCNYHSGLGGSGDIELIENNDCPDLDGGPVWWSAMGCDESGDDIFFRQGPEHTGSLLRLGCGAMTCGAVRLKSGEYWVNDDGIDLYHTGCHTNIIPAAMGEMGDLSVLSVQGYSGGCLECGQDISGPPCTIASGLTGVLTGLIHDTNVALSGEYETFTTTSYSITTGYNLGQFTICELMTTGFTSGDAVLSMVDYMALFANSGICYSEENDAGIPLEELDRMNMNNIGLSFNLPYPPEQVDANEWENRKNAYANKQYYVTYTPVISGQKTAASVDISCPDTNLEVELNREVKIWDSIATAVDESEIIRNLQVTLNGACSGYVYDLVSQCDKVVGGRENFCYIDATNGNRECWEGNFHKGDYIVTYKNGSFATSGGGYTIGTGMLGIDKLI